MARVVMGGIVSEISGSIGGTTYRKSRYGIIISNKTNPVNPNTPDQAQVRANLSDAVAVWATLSENQRAAWDLYGQNTPLMSKSGVLYTPTGRTCFIRSYCAGLAAGIEATVEAPTTFGLPSADPTIVGTISSATQKVSVVFDPTQAWALADGGALIVSMSRPQNPSVNSPRGGFKALAAILGNTTTPPTSPKLLDVVYPCTAGQKVWLEYRILDAEGRLSGSFRLSCTVAA